MTRRKAGTVTAFDGRWRIRATVDGKRVSLGLCDTREEAEAVLAAALAYTGPGRRKVTTLRTYGKGWLDRREKDGHHRHVHVDRSRWARHIETAPFAGKPIRKITRGDVRAWVHLLVRTEANSVKVRKDGTVERKQTGHALSRQSVRHSLNLLRCCLRDALDDEVVPKNVAADVRVPPAAEREGEAWTCLTPAEIAAVTGPAVPEERRLAFAVAIYTGLRAGELWGLRWSDVTLDGDRPKVTVRRSWNGPPKTKTSRREVPLLPPALAALRRWRELRPGVGSALVWPADGGGLHSRSYDGQWERWCGKVLGRHVRFHDLRHTCCSHLISGTWGRPLSIMEVRAWAGHASIQTTQRYAHLAPEAIHAAAAAMAEQWTGR